MPLLLVIVNIYAKYIILTKSIYDSIILSAKVNTLYIRGRNGFDGVFEALGAGSGGVHFKTPIFKYKS